MAAWVEKKIELRKVAVVWRVRNEAERKKPLRLLGELH